MGPLDQTFLRISTSTDSLSFVPARYLLLCLLISLTLILSNPVYAGESIRIASQNMHRFFDNIDNGKNEVKFSDWRFHAKLKAATNTIIERFSLPDILALQEVENRNVLSKIATAVQERTGAQ